MHGPTKGETLFVYPLKVIFLSGIFLLAGFSLSFSQEIIILSAIDNSPLSCTHVRIQPDYSKEATVLIADSMGKVMVSNEFLDKKVLLSLFCMGYERFEDTLVLKKTKIFYLKEESQVLNEIVITAQYAPAKVENTVHNVKIIDAKKIGAMGAQNLRDVLTNEMNVRLTQDNLLGSSMSLQGISGQNVKILIDGVPVIGRLNGNIDVSQINMNNVERIEIIEGPLSVNYGTDALAGTINIITRKKQKNALTASSNNYYESNGQYNFSGKIGYQKNKNFVSLTAGRYYFDGWRTEDRPFFVEKKRIADSLRFKNWKPKEQLFGTFYYGRQIKQLKLGYTGDVFYEEIMNRGLPRLPYYETAFDDYYDTYRINNGISLTGPITKNYYINVICAYNHYKRIKNTYFKDLTTLEEVLTQTPSDQDTTQFNTIMTRGSISSTKDSVRLNYELGYDVNHETGSGLRIKDTKQQIGDYAIFGSVEYKPVSRLVIRPGLRVIHNTAYNAPLVPSLNLKYQLSKKYTVRFSYARGFRAPSVKDLYFYFVDINHNIVGNPELKAEQSHNFNLSTSYFTKSKKLPWKTDASIYYNHIDNMISLAQLAATQFSYFNINTFKTMGIQLQTELSWQHLKFSVGGAYIGRYNMLSETYSFEKFAYSPEVRSTFIYDWYKLKTTFAFFYKYTGTLPSYGLTSMDVVYKTEISDYHIADMSVSKLIQKDRITIGIGIKNLFDVKNINGVSSDGAHSSGGNTLQIGMGRTYFMKLDVNLTGKK